MKGGFWKIYPPNATGSKKTVYDMEKKGGITHRTVENIENGLYNPRNITFTTVVLMSNYLNFPLETAVKMLMEELYESGRDNGEYLEGRCKKF